MDRIVKEKNLNLFSYAYLILPVIIFCIGFLKLYFSIPIVLLLLFIFAIIIKQNKDKNEVFIKENTALIIFILLMVICITAGQGGLFYQSSDHHWRNAIFRDLINFKWPVYYPNMNASLVYYIGFWMVPAAFAKIFLLISPNMAWAFGNMMMLLWSTIGVTLTALWLIKLLKLKSAKKIYIALFIFFFFSGLDAVGAFICSRGIFQRLHLEWWAGYFQFTAILTQLFWVFNQCIAAWLITLMFLDEKRVNNYIMLILLCLPYGPLPFVGLIPLLFYNGLRYFSESIRKSKLIDFLKDVFSIQNIIFLISILPVFYFYYSSNASVTGGQFRLDENLFTNYGWPRLLMFWFLEIGIYGLLIFNKFKREILFHIALISLLFIPIFKIGYGADFSMRASIPSMIVIIYYVLVYLFEEIKIKDKKIILNLNCILLIITLSIGMITPFFEYGRAFHEIKQYKKINLVADSIKTFSDKSIDGYQNFVAVNPEQTIFFKYLSK